MKIKYTNQTFGGADRQSAEEKLSAWLNLTQPLAWTIVNSSEWLIQIIAEFEEEDEQD